MRIGHREKSIDRRPETIDHRFLGVCIKEVIVIFFAVILFCSCVYAEDKPVDISASVENEDIYIGDRINTNIVVTNAKDTEVSFLEVPPNLGDFSFIESKPMEFGWKDKDKKGHIYVMGIYSTGTHVVPPIPVKYKKDSDPEWQVMESPQIPLVIKSTLTGNDTDIKDIRGLLIARSINLILMCIVILLLVMISAAVFWIMAKRKKQLLDETENRIPAHEIAYVELGNLKKEDLPGHGKINEYYVKLSDIVRHYLENRFYLKAPEMTTEEFMYIAKKSSELEEEHKVLLNDFLLRCDMVKFAKYGPTKLEMLDSFSSAERFVDQTKKIEEEESAAENE